MATSLKYTVGIANKFSGLDTDDGSSDEEGKISSTPAPKIATLNDSYPFDTAATKREKGVSTANARYPTPSTDNAAAKDQNGKFGGKAPQATSSHSSNKIRNGKPATTTAPVQQSIPPNFDDQAEFVTSGSNHQWKSRGSQRHDGGPRRGGISRRREFDRQSGTGRGREMKKEGGGRHNWGTAGRTPPQEESNAEPAEIVEANGSDSQQKDGDAADGTKEVAETEKTANKDTAASADKEEPFMMNMAMWKEQQAAKRAGLPVPAGNRSVQDSQTAKKQEAIPVDDHDARHRKTLNVYEYLYESGGHVELFKSHRNRGRRSAGSDRSQRFSRFNGIQPSNYAGIDPPDLQDSRAFPSLGDNQVLT